MSAARRRNALRDFYKLQDQDKKTEDTKGVSNDDDSDDAVKGDIDREGVTVATYVNHIVNTMDLKGVVQHANQLHTEIQSLESEQKALVYNNYNKLISAASTLDALNSMSDLSSIKRLEDIFEAMEKTVQDCKASSQNESTSTNDDIGHKNDIASNSTQNDQKAGPTALTLWLRACDRTITALISEGNKSDARITAKQILEKLDSRTLTDEQALIQSKFQGIAL